MNLPGKRSPMMSKWISSFLCEWMFSNIVLLSCFELVITVADLHKETPSPLYRTHICCLQGLGWILSLPHLWTKLSALQIWGLPSSEVSGFSHCWRRDTKLDGPIDWFNMAIPLLLVFFRLAFFVHMPKWMIYHLLWDMLLHKKGQDQAHLLCLCVRAHVSRERQIWNSWSVLFSFSTLDLTQCLTLLL